MSNRAVVWTLAILAVVLVLIPLLSMLGMMACCGGMMGGMMGSGGMMGTGRRDDRLRRYLDVARGRSCGCSHRPPFPQGRRDAVTGVRRLEDDWARSPIRFERRGVSDGRHGPWSRGNSCRNGK
jgi:hypothetical protein